MQLQTFQYNNNIKIKINENNYLPAGVALLVQGIGVFVLSRGNKTGLFSFFFPEPRQMKTMPMAHITTSTGISPFKRNLRCPESKFF